MSKLQKYVDQAAVEPKIREKSKGESFTQKKKRVEFKRKMA